MPYLIETFDRTSAHSVRKGLTDAHLDFLKRHETRLIACGDKRSDDGKRTLGGLYLVDVPTRQDAAVFIADNPFSAADVFERVTILRFEHSFVNGHFASLRHRLRMGRRLTQT